MELLGIDIGGSGIKGAIVNAATGELVTERLRAPSPSSFQPDEVVAVVAELIKQFNYSGPIGVGFPAVVMRGVVITPPTALAFPNWEGVNLAERISAATGCPTTVGNDADVACLAEMHFGAGKGLGGVVMVFTIGTGIGSALFVNGHIVPNTEMGRLFLRDSKKTAEHLMSDRIREEQGLNWKEWGLRLNDYFNQVELLLWPDAIIIGGGVSKKHEKFFPYIKIRAKLMPAAFRNEAGIVGAAMAALDQHSEQPWELPGVGHSEG
jgi:polyphosphate glucokinase